MARGIKASALSRMVDDASGRDLGAPVFVLSHTSSASSGTTATETIVENAPFAFEVLKAWFVCTEAAAADSEDAKLTNNANAITDTADYSTLSDTESMEWSKLDNAYVRVAAGADLKLVKTASTAITSIDVFVLCARVA